MNQTFNISRFIKYSKFEIILNSKMLILGIGGLFTGLFSIILLLTSNQYQWDHQDWTELFFGLFFALSCLFAGNSFSHFRQKEKTILALMIPASTLEKFLFEYLLRTLLFSTTYLILFTIAAKLAYPIGQVLNPSSSLDSFSINEIVNLRESNSFLYILMPLIYFSISAYLISGSVVFKKYPLVKSLIFVAIVFTITITYFYLLFEKLDLGKGIEYTLKQYFSEKEFNLKLLYIAILTFTLTCLGYGYYKHKEKEV